MCEVTVTPTFFALMQFANMTVIGKSHTVKPQNSKYAWMYKDEGGISFANCKIPMPFIDGNERFPSPHNEETHRAKVQETIGFPEL